MLESIHRWRIQKEDFYQKLRGFICRIKKKAMLMLAEALTLAVAERLGETMFFSPKTALFIVAENYIFCV